MSMAAIAKALARGPRTPWLAASGHDNPAASYPAWRSLAALCPHALCETEEALALAWHEAERGPGTDCRIGPVNPDRRAALHPGACPVERRVARGRLHLVRARSHRPVRDLARGEPERPQVAHGQRVHLERCACGSSALRGSETRGRLHLVRAGTHGPALGLA